MSTRTPKEAREAQERLTNATKRILEMSDEVGKDFELPIIKQLGNEQPPIYKFELPVTHRASCVYFLIWKNKVVYVGRSTSLSFRIQNHIESGKVFDTIYYITVPLSKLADTEAELIKHFRPEYNRKTGRPLRFTLEFASPILQEMVDNGWTPSCRLLAKRLKCGPTKASDLIKAFATKKVEAAKA